jgi:hypothetical protein
MKADVNATSFGKALIASINSSNAGLGSMDDESLPIEDVVHILAPF